MGLSATDYLDVLTEKDGSPDLWLCMDDRPVKPDSVPLEQFGIDEMPDYLQTGGGPYGTALDVAVAYEVAAPNSFVERRITLDSLAKIISTDALQNGDAAMFNHEGCAALLKAFASLRTMQDPDQHNRVLERSTSILPTISESEVEMISEAAGRLIESGLVGEDPEAQTSALVNMQTNDTDGDSIPTAKLIGEHNGKTGKVLFIADYRNRGVLKVQEAADAGFASFHANFGNDLLDLYRAISNIIPLRPRAIRRASTVRHGALMTLLVDEHGDDIPIQLVGAAA